MSANFYQIHRDNHHSNKQKLPCLHDVITHQHDYRLINVWFHENLEFHTTSSISNKQKHSEFKQTKIFLFWWRKTHQYDYWLRWLPQKPWNLCQQQFFKTEETRVQGIINFHILLMHSNYAINISMIIGSVMAASTKTLQFISVTVS